MQKAEQCTVFTAYADGKDQHTACDSPATIKCGGSWWCQEHYDDFHVDGKCMHILPDEE
jgi:hypothetical protein